MVVWRKIFTAVKTYICVIHNFIILEYFSVLKII